MGPIIRAASKAARIGAAGIVVYFGLALMAAGAVADTEHRFNPGPDSGDIEGEEEQEENSERDPEFDSGPETPGRQSLSSMSRQELDEQGFVFEDILIQRRRAHATVFALTAGVIVPGAGHRHLDDGRTAWSLAGMDVAALTLIATGVGLANRPTGVVAIDDRRRELWFVGTGLLGASWLMDVFGTAYRDDLGIPSSTRRTRGWGVEIGYQYWRPRDLSMRHLSSASVVGQSENFEVQARTAQELGLGMSDYEVGGTWFPFVGVSPDTRLGFGLSGRFVDYRLDAPFERADITATVDMSMNVGRVFAHLDQMTVGGSVGMAARGYRFSEQPREQSRLRYAGWHLPLRMYLALNLTDQLRMTAAFERRQGNWIERSRGRVGIPSVHFSYRSTERLDLRFFAAGGNGAALGAGLRMWFGE